MSFGNSGENSSHRNKDIYSFPQYATEELELNTINQKLKQTIQELNSMNRYQVKFVPGYAPEHKIHSRRNPNYFPLIHDSLSFDPIEQSVSQDMGLYLFDSETNERTMIVLDGLSEGRLNMNTFEKEFLIMYMYDLMYPGRFENTPIRASRSQDMTCAAIVKIKPDLENPGYNKVKIKHIGDCTVFATWKTKNGQYKVGFLTIENTGEQAYQLGNIDNSIYSAQQFDRYNVTTFIEAGNSLIDENPRPYNRWTETNEFLIPDTYTLVACTDGTTGAAQNSERLVNPLDGFVETDNKSLFKKQVQIPQELYDMLTSGKPKDVDRLYEYWSRIVQDDQCMLFCIGRQSTPTLSQ